MADPLRDPWNGTRFVGGGPAGHYESWFQRANDPSGRYAFWIRYTIFAPHSTPSAAVGELWAIVFDRGERIDGAGGPGGGAGGPATIVAVKEVVPLSSCEFARDRLDVKIGEARLDGSALRGRAASGEHSISWDLRYGGGGAPLLLLPERLYQARLPRAKALVGQPLARFSGELVVDGERLELTDWVGSQNHNWGSKHTDQYAWGQVAGFDERADAFLECSTARLRLGPLWLPQLSPVLLRLGEETLRWNSLPRAVRARGSYRPYEWTIETDGPDGQLSLRISADPSDFVALRYANPPGGTKICLNSKIARCELSLRRGGVTTELRSSRAAFEILADEAPPGVTPVA
jgi:hypothetical protein